MSLDYQEKLFYKYTAKSYTAPTEPERNFYDRLADVMFKGLMKAYKTGNAKNI